jgi:hypothetical protein
MRSNLLHTSWESLMQRCCAVTAGSLLLGILPVWPATPFAYDIPPYTGQRYTDRVPDTLDLAERARLALNALTRPVDPERDYSLYFLATWNQNPPVLRHEAGSDDCLGKFIGPQVLNRIVSGSDANLDLERSILDHAYLSDPPGRVLCRNGASARVLEGFIFRYLRDHNPGWKAMVRQTLQGWIDTLYCPPGTNYGYWRNEGTPFTAGVWGQNPWKDEILLLASRQFGWPQALETARRHINYVVHHCGCFDWASGRFLGYHDQPADARVHFHIHGLYLKVFLECGLLTGDTNLVGFVQRSYRWARSEAAGSAPVLGFFPEFVNQSDHSEGCAISDMLDLALMLSEAGVEDCWDDADRWLRNHFAESQLTPEKGARLQDWALSQPRRTVQPNESSDQTTDRSLGAFAGWPGVNEWHPTARGIQHCCTGNASRSIFCAWHAILDESGDGLTVNLLLNRAARKADLYSYLPYEGRLDLHVKQPCAAVVVRLPGYVPADSLRCTADGVPRKTGFSGRYAQIGPVAAGVTITLRFANPTTNVTQTVCGRAYHCTLRGNTVVRIDPPGVVCPLYDRQAMMASTAPAISLTRFVSDETKFLDQNDLHQHPIAK